MSDEYSEIGEADGGVPLTPGCGLIIAVVAISFMLLLAYRSKLDAEISIERIRAGEKK
jgi:hypothetical protein